MNQYRNLGGKSGVVAYECSPDSIAVQFKNGAVYNYTYQSAGSFNIERMKQLAEAGSGLSTFIDTTVKKQYASKSP